MRNFDVLDYNLQAECQLQIALEERLNHLARMIDGKSGDLDLYLMGLYAATMTVYHCVSSPFTYDGKIGGRCE